MGLLGERRDPGGKQESPYSSSQVPNFGIPIVKTAIIEDSRCYQASGNVPF